MNPQPQTTQTETSSEIRAPYKVRDKMSRPSSSVPIQCARDEDARHAKLRRVLADDGRLRVMFDRRADRLRNPGWVNRSLRTLGFAVVRMSSKPHVTGVIGLPFRFSCIGEERLSGQA